jgi:hypothetical protein
LVQDGVRIFLKYDPLLQQARQLPTNGTVAVFRFVALVDWTAWRGDH